MSNPSGDSTISDLPVSVPFTGTEQFVIDQVQSGILVTARVSSNNLANYLLSLPTTVMQPANGGTGQTSLTAHNVVLGEGTSPVGFAAPGAAGIPLISTGPAADPAFGTATVPGGGTGRTTLTAHGVLLGEGTSAINQTTAGTTGQALVSGGASADPAFGVTLPVGGGTGLATLTAHAVLIGEGTNNVAFAAPSTAGQALISAGAAADPVFGFPTGALLNIQRITSTGTYTKTAGTNTVMIELAGGGGAGGGAPATGASQVSVGGGGSAGGYVRHLGLASAFTGLTATIGAAGAGNSGAAGGAGGNTTLGTLTANGGNGGISGTAGSSSNGNNSASGGTASGGSLMNVTGQQGGPSAGIFGSAVIVGVGAPHHLGSGGNNGISATGGAATGFGAGGGGTFQTASSGALTGGAGAGGVAIIWEFA